MKVTYIGPVQDLSGYAEAARNNIGALLGVGVDLDVLPLSFESFKSDLGILGEIVNSKITHRSDAKIQIIHATPNTYDRLIKPGKYNIGYTVWETSHLPTDWVENINRLNEVWVPCKENVNTFKNSGVKVPIKVIPHTFTTKFDKDIPEIVIPKFEDHFLFYSIFQWTERKNPVALLKAFLTEFKEDEKVLLILKTYLFDPTNDKERIAIQKTIQDIKNKLHLPNYPKIYLITELFSRERIKSLHKTGDCYLSFHRNEGYGIPIVEGMMAGNPCIYTNYSAPTEYLNANIGFPVSYQLTPVFGMPWDTYKGTQVWADINVMEARERMREAFQNKELTRWKGNLGREFVEDNLGWEKIGNLMLEELRKI